VDGGAKVKVPVRPQPGPEYMEIHTLYTAYKIVLLIIGEEIYRLRTSDSPEKQAIKLKVLALKKSVAAGREEGMRPQLTPPRLGTHHMSTQP
jgi:hypothetical protein